MTHADSEAPDAVRPSRLKVWAPLFLFCLLALAVSSLLYDRMFDTYDDGIAATGAWLVLHGGVPYKDFWTVYAPGSYYANALLLLLFGESLLSIRLVLPFLVVVQAGFLYGILRRLVPGRYAAVAAGTAYLALVPVGISVTHNLTYWTTFALAVAYFLVRWTEEPLPRWEYALGLSLGLGTLFRQDGGFYAAAVLIPLLYIAAPRVGAERRHTIIRVFGPFAAVLGVCAAYLALKGALGAMFEDALKFAVFTFPHSRSVAYPIPMWSLSIAGRAYRHPPVVGLVHQLFNYYALPASLAAFALVSVFRLRTPKLPARDTAAAAVSCLAAVLFLMVIARPTSVRIAGTVVLGVVTFAAYSTDRSKAVRSGAAAMLVFALLGLVPFAVSNVRLQRHYSSNMIAVKGGIYTLAGYGDAISLASAYLREHTAPEERILSGTPVIYFTADRRPSTIYYEPQPYLIDRPDVQQSIIEEMERQHVRFFVRSRKGRTDSYFATEREYEPRMVIGYVERNYKRAADLCMLQIYERKTPFRSR